MFKDEWIESFEKEKARKPTPKEFIEAKNAGLFLTEDAKDSSDSIENPEQILNSPIIPMMADGIEHGEKVELTTSPLSNSNHSQKEQPLKKFCYKCGNQLQIDSDYYPKCGAKFGSTDGEHSFLTDITEKISDVSSLASKKTKELTSNVRTNIEVSLEKRKLDALFKQLGEAYYSNFANDWDSEFQSLVSQIKEYEEKINQLDPSYKKSKGRVWMMNKFRELYMVNKTQGHGSIKKLRTGAVVSVLALSFMGANEMVKADEVSTATAEVTSTNNSQTTVADSTTQEAGTDTTSPVAESQSAQDVEEPVVQEAPATAETVAQAKDYYDVAQSAVNTQEGIVANAQSDVTNAEKAVDQAQSDVNDAQKLVEQATPENIAKQEQDVQDKTTNVTNAEKAVTNAKAKEDQAAQNVTNQEQVVSEAKTEVSAAQDEVNTAQKDVDTAQAILDGTNQASVIKEADDAKANLEKATSAVKDAQAKLDAAKQVDTTRANNISALEKELEATKKSQADAQAQVDSATKAHDSAQTALTDANNKFTKAENDYKAINTIKLNSEYIAALKKYAHNGGDSAVLKEASATLASLYDWGRKNNTFKSNPNDTTTTYDINNLPEDKIKELSFFASDLINQIREQMGTPKTAVNDDAVKLADLTTDGYVADNWSWAQVRSIGHDAKAVNNAAKTFGLFTSSGKTEEEGGQFYENMMTTYSNVSRVTMDDAKRRVYNAIVGFIFNPYEWMHAESIAGETIAGETIDDGSTVTYIGVDLSSRDDATGVHVLGVDSEDAKGTTFSTQQLANPRSAEALTKAYNDAKTLKTNAEAKELSTRNALTQAKNSKASADQNVNAVTANLTKAKAVPVQTPVAQAKLATANTTLASATERNNKAQEALNALTADVKVKKANLDKAKSVLTDKTATLKAKQNTLYAEENKLASLKSLLEGAKQNVSVAERNFAQAKQELKDSQDYLTKLKDAPNVLVKAKDILVNAQADLQVKQAKLEKEQAKLEELIALRDKAKSAYDELNVRYQAKLEEERKAHVEAERQAILAKGGIPVAIRDDKGNIIGYKEQAITNKIPVSVNYNLEGNGSVADKTLPETGETSSTSILAVGGLMAIASLSLVATARSKKEEK